jgi:hypothetical protein
MKEVVCPGLIAVPGRPLCLHLDAPLRYSEDVQECLDERQTYRLWKTFIGVSTILG